MVTISCTYSYHVLTNIDTGLTNISSSPGKLFLILRHVDA